jgi:hypothetical protein
MYVLVRRDLSHPQQVVQACHASIEAARVFIADGAAHPFVIVCGIRDGPALANCLERLNASGIAHRAFYEPDLGGQLTAIATAPLSPEQRQFFRKYQLLRSRG